MTPFGTDAAQAYRVSDIRFATSRAKLSGPDVDRLKQPPMTSIRRRRAPPAFVRWLQLLLAQLFAKEHAATLALRLPRVGERSGSAQRGRSRVDDFAPTQVMKRTDYVVDSRGMYWRAGVDVSEEDLETLPAELREAFAAGHHRARRRGENAAAA